MPIPCECVDGAVWCQWCGEYPTSEGVPCDRCVSLGADESDLILCVDG